jgi:hypothetical protein
VLFDFTKELDIKKARENLEKMITNKSKGELKLFRELRTLDQNAYLHVCLAVFCKEIGYTRNEALEAFSYLLPELMRIDKNGMNFTRSTTTMDTKEMGELIDKIREICLDQLGIYIPESEEYLINQFEIEQELRNSREGR